MRVLSEQEIASHLGALSEWRIEKGELTRTFTFKDFLAALAFVNLVGERAEAAGHHPDIDIRYNKVRLGLVSHDAGVPSDRSSSLGWDAGVPSDRSSSLGWDAGGLTVKDFDLAAIVNRLV